MQGDELNAVTGAFGYTGKYIAQRLLSMGKRVITLTGHPARPSPLRDQVPAFPFSFDNPARLAESLRGVTTLYNTYWIRFPYRGMTYEQAVDNSRILISAAEEAGVRRIVHISITSASPQSPLPYFRGKGQVEDLIKASRLSYAMLRPTVIFGREDILINNIAWIVRKFPAFGIPGDGEYRLQPVYVEEVAEMAVDAGQRHDNIILDAVGPETYTFNQLVRLIAQKVGSRAKLVHLPPGLALLLAQVIGYAVKDVVLTSDEVDGLMAGLLVSEGPPTGKARLSEWLEANSHTVGTRYASELARHF